MNLLKSLPRNMEKIIERVVIFPFYFEAMSLVAACFFQLPHFCSVPQLRCLSLKSQLKKLWARFPTNQRSLYNLVICQSEFQITSLIITRRPPREIP